MEIIGCSPAIQQIKTLIQQVAITQANVLINGESGTGKELIAKVIHAQSLRNKEAFIAVNCAAIPSELLESELFGHEKGAFTGAINQRCGRFEAASKGTIFLDEIGEMPLAMQAKLLRVLQERTFERIGSNLSVNTDMRVIAATNCDLKTAIKERNFREDLYYRLNVFPISVPPLRDRQEDIELLIDHFFNKFKQLNQLQNNLDHSARKILSAYPWPGNVREISNLMERLCILYPQQTIKAKDLPAEISYVEKVADFNATIMTQKKSCANLEKNKNHKTKNKG